MNWKRLRRDRRGIIAIEAAVLAPVFLLFVVGLFDVGMFSVEMNAAQMGVQAGGQYVMNRTAGIGVGQCRNTVQNASPMLTNATVTCQPTGDGSQVTVTASIPYAGVLLNGMFNFSTISASYTVPFKAS